jgi:hypothetical protein
VGSKPDLLICWDVTAIAGDSGGGWWTRDGLVGLTSMSPPAIARSIRDTYQALDILPEPATMVFEAFGILIFFVAKKTKRMFLLYFPKGIHI